MLRLAPILAVVSSFGNVLAVRYLGRVNPSTKQLTWPSTGVSFTFTGTTASIGITSINYANSADLFVDGVLVSDISNVSGTSITIPTQSYGNHTVELRKRSETAYGTFSLSTITTDGTIRKDIKPKRRIEIIGDSISVGYGLDGTAPCSNTAAIEDNPLTYGALAANMLQADYSVVAWSGKGLIRNGGAGDTSPLMPELFTRYGANDADNSYTFPAGSKPNAVVITLGTNDWNYYNTRPPINATQFSDAMVSFVQSIEGHYPNAQFFLLGSPMLSDAYPTTADAQHTTQLNAVKAAASKLGAKAHVVDWPTQGSATGCDNHPNASTHAAQGKRLASAIKTALGW